MHVVWPLLACLEWCLSAVLLGVRCRLSGGSDQIFFLFDLVATVVLLWAHSW